MEPVSKRTRCNTNNDSPRQSKRNKEQLAKEPAKTPAATKKQVAKKLVAKKPAKTQKDRKLEAIVSLLQSSEFTEYDERNVLNCSWGECGDRLVGRVARHNFKDPSNNNEPKLFRGLITEYIVAQDLYEVVFEDCEIHMLKYWDLVYGCYDGSSVEKTQAHVNKDPPYFTVPSGLPMGAASSQACASF